AVAARQRRHAGQHPQGAREGERRDRRQLFQEGRRRPQLRRRRTRRALRQGMEEPVTGPDRLPPISPDQQTAAQQQAHAEFRADRHHEAFGPFVPLSRSPRLMMHASKMGQFLRYGSSLPRDVSEFAILLQSRRWSQPYEWYVHAPDAKRAGISDAIVEAIAGGRPLGPLPERLQVVYDFCTELNDRHAVSDATYAKTVAMFGEQGMMDLVGVNGYYALIAMVLNVARTPLPPGHEPFK